MKGSSMEPNWVQDEGAKAFEQGKKIEENPYPHDSQHWWHNEEWEKGWKKAEAAYNDD